MKTFLITTNDAGQRLDRFLKKLLPNAALALIYKLNRTWRVRVDGARQDNEYRLIEAQTVTLKVSDEDWTKLQQKQKPSIASASSDASLKGSKLRLDPKSVIFEDADMLVVNKLPGVNVHPWEHKTTELSLIDMVQDYLGDKLRSLTFKPSLVHRLDRDTSGAIMIAKTKPALLALLDSLQNHKIEKTYLVVVIGKPPETRGTIRKKLLRTSDDEREWNAKVIISEDGQSAVTHYETLHSDVFGKYSVLACRIETGRMHQIRVHLASLGCPVLGDKMYGDTGENGFARREYGIARQLLHAWKLSFPHPIQTKRTVSLQARVSEDMARFVPQVKDTQK